MIKISYGKKLLQLSDILDPGLSAYRGIFSSQAPIKNSEFYV